MANRKKKGYAQKLIQRINEADGSLAGVKLGKLCVQLAIPISDVAGFFGVSKPTIYAWFTGTGKPRSGDIVEKVDRVIVKLEAKVGEKSNVEESAPEPKNEEGEEQFDEVTA